MPEQILVLLVVAFIALKTVKLSVWVIVGGLIRKKMRRSIPGGRYAGSLDIVVYSRNCENDCQATIASVKQAAKSIGKIRVLLVDNASDDASFRKLKRGFADIGEVLVLGKRKVSSRSEALRQLIDKFPIESEYVYTVDAGQSFQTHDLLNAIKYMRRHNLCHLSARTTIGAVTSYAELIRTYGVDIRNYIWWLGQVLPRKNFDVLLTNGLSRARWYGQELYGLPRSFKSLSSRKRLRLPKYQAAPWLELHRAVYNGEARRRFSGWGLAEFVVSFTATGYSLWLAASSTTVLPLLIILGLTAIEVLLPLADYPAKPRNLADTSINLPLLVTAKLLTPYV